MSDPAKSFDLVPVGMPTPAIYATQVQIAFGLEEAYIAFGQQVPNTELIIPVARICISIAHAKRLRDILNRLVEGYEAKLGEVAAYPDTSVLEDIPPAESKGEANE